MKDNKILIERLGEALWIALQNIPCGSPEECLKVAAVLLTVVREHDSKKLTRAVKALKEIAARDGDTGPSPVGYDGCCGCAKSLVWTAEEALGEIGETQ